MVFFSEFWGIIVAVWGGGGAAVAGGEGMRELDALLEVNLDPRLEAVVGRTRTCRAKS